jgi:hypothetical protein
MAELAQNPHVDSDEGKTAQNDVWANGIEGGTAPVEQHSPTKVHVPRWKTIVLGGSGGVLPSHYKPNREGEIIVISP